MEFTKFYKFYQTYWDKYDFEANLDAETTRKFKYAIHSKMPTGTNSLEPPNWMIPYAMSKKLFLHDDFEED